MIWLEARERIVREADCVRVVGTARDVTEARHSGGGSPPAGAPGAGDAAPREPRAGDGRRRARLQQPPDGDPRQRPAGARRAAARTTRCGRASSGCSPPRSTEQALTEQMLVYAGRAPRAQKPIDLSWLVAEMLDLARALLPARVTLREELGAGGLGAGRRDPAAAGGAQPGRECRRGDRRSGGHGERSAPVDARERRATRGASGLAPRRMRCSRSSTTAQAWTRRRASACSSRSSARSSRAAVSG